jgi:dihydroorotate dehydrogenase
MTGIYRALRPALFCLDPERSHALALAALSRGFLSARPVPADPALRIDVLGLTFPAPVGMAAGFDKNGIAVDGLFGLGFGFVEVGSTTPLAQAGNPRPRIFRLSADGAIINRLGFNNDGHDALLRSLLARRRTGIVGVNLGANKDSGDRIGDYVRGVERFHDVAQYLCINVSSPNTPGLRTLQSGEQLRELLDRVGMALSRLAIAPPVLLKISPDVEEKELEEIAAAALGGGIGGIIVSNTTITRPPLASSGGGEAGGLSGRPLFELSTRQLARLFAMTSGRVPLVGTGGIDSAAAAFEKIRAGASLVQLYTGLVYRGPGLVADILEGLSRNVRQAGLQSIRNVVGTGVSDWL